MGMASLKCEPPAHGSPGLDAAATSRRSCFCSFRRCRRRRPQYLPASHAAISHASHAGSTYTRLAFLGQQHLVQWSAIECYTPPCHHTARYSLHAAERSLACQRPVLKGLQGRQRRRHTPHQARCCRSPGFLPACCANAAAGRRYARHRRRTTLFLASRCLPFIVRC